MDFEDIKRIFLSGDERLIADTVYKIGDMTDISALISLSMHAGEFNKLASGLPRDSYFRSSALQAAHLLNRVANGGCYCEAYPAAEYNPEYKARMGALEIASIEVNDEERSRYYVCYCCACERRYNVTSIEGPYSNRYIWRKMGSKNA